MAAIEIKAVSKSYALNRKQSVLALRNIDLTVAECEFVALLGPSGCGKSTLLHLLAALEEPSTGSILIDNQPPSSLRSQHRLGIAFQDHALLPWLTVQANIALPFKIAALIMPASTISSSWLDYRASNTHVPASFLAECASAQPLPVPCVWNLRYSCWMNPLARWMQ